MLNFIKEALNILEVHCKRIYLYAEFKDTEDRICSKNANYLKHEAKKKYRYNLYLR